MYPPSLSSIALDCRGSSLLFEVPNQTVTDNPLVGDVLANRDPTADCWGKTIVVEINLLEG